MSVYDDIRVERESQRPKHLAEGIDIDEFDKSNSRNDWIAYATGYLGRASDKMFRNQRDGCDYRQMLVKAGAIIVAALEAHDKGYS